MHEPFAPLEMLGSACEIRANASADRIKGIERSLHHTVRADVAYRRIEQLVDPGTFLPIGSLFDPKHNPEETVGVITGIAHTHGQCVCVIASNPAIRKGAWIPAQPEAILRIQRLAELLRTPILQLLECSGLDLERQEQVYTGFTSGGRIFYNNARLAARGIPIIAGIFGTNVAGGGYSAISATYRFAHRDATMAVGGAAILSGMGSEVKRIPPPGSTAIHTETGFFDGVFDTEAEVIAAMRTCIPHQETSDPLACWDIPDPPRFSTEALHQLLPDDPTRTYDINEVLARIIDGGRVREFMPGYGPEVMCVTAQIEDHAVGIVANRQGPLPRGYPEYADYAGIGGKLYRQGLIKMIKFVEWCDTQQTPMVWLQDTSGIDVGDQAERAGLLGLGQALIHVIENVRVPMATIVLRKGHAASHYVMCGPMASSNALTLGTAITEIMVMHRESAAMALYGRSLQKASGEERHAISGQMNALTTKYGETSSPRYAAQQGWIDEAVPFMRIRDYLSWFAHAAHASLVLAKEPVRNLWDLYPRIVEEAHHASRRTK